MLIEIQIRTKLQHAWATAVEAVGSIMGEDMKGGEGNLDWLRFFALMSSEIAEDEGCCLVPGTPETTKERQKEIRALDVKLGAIQSLDRLREAVRAVTSVRGCLAKAYIVSLDADHRTVSINSVPKGASVDSYRAAERTSASSVLVEVDKAEDLRDAYPNYFLDVGEFTAFVKKSVNGLKSRPSTQEGLLAFLRGGSR
jgi:hypothetical protein